MPFKCTFLQNEKNAFKVEKRLFCYNFLMAYDTVSRIAYTFNIRTYTYATQKDGKRECCYNTYLPKIYSQFIFPVSETPNEN